MKIGSFGSEVVFQVSADRMFTFDGLSRSKSVKVANHQLINRPDKVQFSGRELDKVSFKMDFVASLGVVPHEEIEKLHSLLSEGAVRTLRIGKVIFGKFMLKSVKEDWREVDGQGNLLKASVSVDLEEYV